MLDHHEDRESGERTEELPRVELLRVARSLHVSDADVMTRAELRAAIDKARRPEPRPKNQPVTWVSVARRLLASIVEQGLHLPDAAALIRGDTTLSSPPKAPPPVATVTLARIYAAQGHLSRALGTLDEVLATDADHDLARALREQLRKQLDEQNRNASQRPPENVEPPAHESPPSAEAAPPNAEADPPSIDAAPPSIDAAPPGIGAAPPSIDADPPSIDADPPSVDAAPPSIDAAPPSVDAAPPSVDAAPPSIDLTPRPKEPPAEPTPRGPELIIIEAEESRAYIYWELPWPQTGSPSDPHWIWVVAHTPTSFGCDRMERRYPVSHDSGAIRVEGLPQAAVVRAKLTRDAEPSSRPLAVASSVKATSLEARFTPHSRANPKALADRAMTRVDGAGAAYW